MPSIIFLDPPYYQENIKLILLKILNNKIKSDKTIIIVETNKNEELVIPNKLKKFKEKIYGKTKILFLN